MAPDTRPGGPGNGTFCARSGMAFRGSDRTRRARLRDRLRRVLVVGGRACRVARRRTRLAASRVTALR